MYGDDNFGEWEQPDNPDDAEAQAAFRQQVQAESIKKRCSMCDAEVMLRPHYDKCDSCCRQIESGAQW